jgi:hypothetical protein
VIVTHVEIGDEIFGGRIALRDERARANCYVPAFDFALYAAAGGFDNLSCRIREKSPLSRFSDEGAREKVPGSLLDSAR